MASYGLQPFRRSPPPPLTSITYQGRFCLRDNVYTSLNITGQTVIKSRMRWAGLQHNSPWETVAKSERKRPLGKVRRLWADNIKVDLKYCGKNRAGPKWLRAGSSDALLWKSTWRSCRKLGISWIDEGLNLAKTVIYFASSYLYRMVKNLKWNPRILCCIM
jgi:hypothetical protein